MNRRIIAAAQRLAGARTLEEVTDCITRTTRAMLEADGCCFVIREEDVAYYADEDAIRELFLGRRFPLESCVSGLAMKSGEPVVVEDVSNDPRVATEIYEPTFVESLLMVPIIAEDAIGAIGAYWAKPGRPSQEAIEALRTLARTAALALENLRLIASLKAERSRYRAVIEAQGEYIVRWRPDGISSFVSPSFCQRTGRDKAQLLGTVVFRSPGERPVASERLAALTPSEHSFFSEYSIADESGKKSWERWCHTGLFDDHGKLVEMQSVGREVTEEFEVKENLATTAAQLRAVFNGVQQSIILFDTDFRVLTANPSAVRAAKHILPVELAPGVSAADLFGEFSYPDFVNAAQKALSEGSVRSSRKLKAGGQVRSFEAHYHRVQDDEGRNIGLVLSVLDTTEQMQLETELRQRERVALMGQLALRVAHDFNNLLTPIMCISSDLQDAEDLTNGSRRDAGIVLDAAERGASLTRQLLAFTRKGILELTLVDVNEVLSSVTGLLRRIVPGGIEIALETSEPRATVRGDSGQIHQLFMNLGVNAMEAMEGAGRIEFRVAVHEGRVVVEVSDTGGGIAEDDLPFIFEPHFTTKGQTGSGLGLATSAGIAEQHGGTIHAQPREPQGTTFTVELPHWNQTTAPTSLSPLRRGATSFATILVVDQSDGVRQAVTRAARPLAATVLQAKTAEQALQQLKEDAPVDVLITDMHLPGMSGVELAQKARNMKPELRIIVMSTQKPESSSTSLSSSMVFLAKPFSRGQLHDALERAS